MTIGIYAVQVIHTQAEIDAGGGRYPVGTRVIIVDAAGAPTGAVYESQGAAAPPVSFIGGGGASGGYTKGRLTTATPTAVQLTFDETHIETGAIAGQVVTLNNNNFRNVAGVRVAGKTMLFNYTGSDITVNLLDGATNLWGGGISEDGDLTNDASAPFTVAKTLIVIPSSKKVLIIWDADGWVRATGLGIEVTQAELNAASTGALVNITTDAPAPVINNDRLDGSVHNRDAVYTFPNRRKIESLTFTMPAPSSGPMETIFLYGSNIGTGWTLLSYTDINNFPVAGSAQTLVGDGNAYQYYRITSSVIQTFAVGPLPTDSAFKAYSFEAKAASGVMRLRGESGNDPAFAKLSGAIFGGRLQMDSTTDGVLLPRMTSAQKVAIASPPSGLGVHDTTLSSLAAYNGSNWHFLGSAQNALVTDTTLSIHDSGALFHNNGATGAITLTLPAQLNGVSYTFTVAAAQTLIVQRSGTDTIRLSGSTVTNLRSLQVGATVTIRGVAGLWYVTSMVGTWSDV
jgi:hypothetical protein